MNEKEAHYNIERHKNLDLHKDAMNRRITFFGIISAGAIAFSVAYCTSLKNHIHLFGVIAISWVAFLISIITTYEALTWELKIYYWTGKRLDAWLDNKMDDLVECFSKLDKMGKVYIVLNKTCQYSLYFGIILMAIFIFTNIYKEQVLNSNRYT